VADKVEAEVCTAEEAADAATGLAEIPTTDAVATMEVVENAVVGGEMSVGSSDLAGQSESEVHIAEGMTDAATSPAEIPTIGAVAATEAVEDAVVCVAVAGREINVGSSDLSVPLKSEVCIAEGMSDVATGPAEIPTIGAVAATEAVEDAVVGGEMSVSSSDLAGQSESEVHIAEGMTDAATGPAEIPTTGAVATTEAVENAVVGGEMSVGSPDLAGQLVAEVCTEQGVTLALSGTKRHNRYSKRQIDTDVHNADGRLSSFCLDDSSGLKMRCRSSQKKSVMSSAESSTCPTVSISSARVTRGAIAKSLLSNQTPKKPIQFKGSPVKRACDGKVLYLPTKVKRPLNSKSRPSLGSTSSLEAGCSSANKAGVGKTTKQPRVHEVIFSLSKKEKQQSKRHSSEDPHVTDLPNKKNKVRGSVVNNATLLQERRQLLKGRYAGMDESGDDEDDDYVPKQGSRSVSLKPQPTRKKTGKKGRVMLLKKQQDTPEDRPAETDDESDIGSHSSDSYEDMTDCSSVSDIEPDSDNNTEVQTEDNSQVSHESKSQIQEDWFVPRGLHQQFTFQDCPQRHLVDADEVFDPMTFYSLFLDDDIITMMVTETNRYAARTAETKQLQAQSRMRVWSDTNPTEMRQFCGLLLWMGLVRMPTIDCYWRKSSLYRNNIAGNTMTRNRFQLMLANWHFADNEEAAGDRTHKVNALMKALITKFANARNPAEDIVIDETMIAFRGRLQFRQYLPGKAHKYGVKIFKLCDKTGYTYNMTIYKGKNDRTFSMPTEIVLNLSQPYLTDGRTLVTDNFYTSVELATKLLQSRTHLVGTVRSNRKSLPRAVTAAHLKKGEVIARQNNDGVHVLKWRDRRDVMVLSTKHGGNLVNTGKKNRKQEIIQKPEAVLYYNSIKQGIDVSDQMSSYHSPLRKSIRWFHKVAMEFLLGTAVVNAWLLYNEHCRSVGLESRQLQMAGFREFLAMSLLNASGGSDRRSVVESNPVTSTATHFLQVQISYAVAEFYYKTEGEYREYLSVGLIFFFVHACFAVIGICTYL